MDTEIAIRIVLVCIPVAFYIGYWLGKRNEHKRIKEWLEYKKAQARQVISQSVINAPVNPKN